MNIKNIVSVSSSNVVFRGQKEGGKGLKLQKALYSLIKTKLANKVKYQYNVRNNKTHKSKLIGWILP